MHILLVEDEPTLLNFAALGLERAGHRVARANSAKLALELATQQPPDLLMTDIVLGGESGIDLIAVLRSHRPDLPVLIWSGLPAQTLPQILLHQPRIRFEQKPLSVQRIIACVGEMLTEHALADQPVARL